MRPRPAPSSTPGQGPRAGDETRYSSPQRRSCAGLTDIRIGVLPSLSAPWFLKLSRDGLQSSAPLWINQIQFGRVAGWSEKRYYADNCSRMLVVVDIQFADGSTISYLYEVGEHTKSER